MSSNKNPVQESHEGRNTTPDTSAARLRGIAAMQRALDDAAKEVSPVDATEWEKGLERWARELMTPAAWAQLSLSEEALDIVTEMIPAASVTQEMLDRLAARRREAVSQAARRRELASNTTASSPGELLKQLRKRGGALVDEAAGILQISPKDLVAIETQQKPWYHLDPSTLPEFARRVSEPLSNLVLLFCLTAQKQLIAGIKERAGLSLARSDETQDVVSAARDRLRMAFASVEEENRAAAQFLVRATVLVSDARQVPHAD